MNRFSKLISGVLTIFVIPVTVLNIFAGIVGGLWLILTGDFGLVVYGIISGIIGGIIISIVMMLTMIGSPIVSWGADHRNHFVVALGGFVASSITALVALVASGGLFFNIVTQSDSVSKFAAALLGYAVAMAPWQYMASKEMQASGGGNMNGTMIGIFFIGTGLAISTVLYGLAGYSATVALVWLGVSMILYVITATIIAYSVHLDNNHLIGQDHEQN